MLIAGLQKLTMLDYPGKFACCVFLQGCNYRCPFCHNSDLLGAQALTPIAEDEFFSFLQDRKQKNILEGVCVSGGEPTLQSDLPDFLRKIKDMGFCVKLDSNGTNPDMLKTLAKEGLIDYVAMDIKNSPERYALTAGLEKVDLEAIEESIRFLTSGVIDYEFRTTVVEPLHDAQSIEDMAGWLNTLMQGRKVTRFYIQPFADRDTVLFSGLSAPSKDTMDGFCRVLTPYTSYVSIRG
ncbi:MAG: anaerobic ribonucleoside-triphosphate reductase activating protein [Clostridia bacterium]|nr:anaerobic ribonucleoside-triphosphate reductase activating protein [Clostridia bacterium]